MNQFKKTRKNTSNRRNARLQTKLNTLSRKYRTLTNISNLRGNLLSKLQKEYEKDTKPLLENPTKLSRELLSKLTKSYKEQRKIILKASRNQLKNTRSLFNPRKTNTIRHETLTRRRNTK